MASPVSWASLFRFLVPIFRSERATTEHRLAALEAKLAMLESRPVGVGAKYCGVWIDGAQYAEGSLTTFRGGLWCSKRATTEKPGTADWILCVKSGTAVGRDDTAMTEPWGDFRPRSLPHLRAWVYNLIDQKLLEYKAALLKSDANIDPVALQQQIRQNRAECRGAFEAAVAALPPELLFKLAAEDGNGHDAVH
jgi:hypothetical protein